MKQKTYITLHPEVKTAGMKFAKTRGRSLSNLIERLLEREMEAAERAGDALEKKASETAEKIERVKRKKAK
jgi:predicted CopG family antitoxin